jgi:hypothetical protein
MKAYQKSCNKKNDHMKLTLGFLFLWLLFQHANLTLEIIFISVLIFSYFSIQKKTLGQNHKMGSILWGCGNTS